MNKTQIKFDLYESTNQARRDGRAYVIRKDKNISIEDAIKQTVDSICKHIESDIKSKQIIENVIKEAFLDQYNDLIEGPYYNNAFIIPSTVRVETAFQKALNELDKNIELI